MTIPTTIHFMGFSDQTYRHRRNLLLISTIILFSFFFNLELKSIPYFKTPPTKKELQIILTLLSIYFEFTFICAAYAEITHFYHPEGYSSDSFYASLTFPQRILFSIKYSLKEFVKGLCSFFMVDKGTNAFKAKIMLDAVFPSLMGFIAIFTLFYSLFLQL